MAVLEEGKIRREQFIHRPLDWFEGRPMLAGLGLGLAANLGFLALSLPSTDLPVMARYLSHPVLQAGIVFNIAFPAGLGWLAGKLSHN